MSDDYDDIDVLIDTDAIALGQRCRAAETLLAEAVALLHQFIEADDAAADGADFEIEMQAIAVSDARAFLAAVMEEKP